MKTSRFSRPSLRAVSGSCILPQFITQDRTGRSIRQLLLSGLFPRTLFNHSSFRRRRLPLLSGGVSQLQRRYGSAFNALGQTDHTGYGLLTPTISLTSARCRQRFSYTPRIEIANDYLKATWGVTFSPPSRLSSGQLLKVLYCFRSEKNA